MNFRIKQLAILSLSIITSTVSVAQQPPLKPGMRPPQAGLRPGDPRPPQNGGILVPGPSGGGTTQPPPPVVVEPTLLKVDVARLTEIAERAGRIYANEVLNKVGDLYNVRYNFIQGLRKAKNEIGDHDSIATIRNRSNVYSESLVQSKLDGAAAGRSAGVTAAENVANRLADLDITTEIDEVLDQGSTMQWKQNARSEPFSGYSSPVSSPSSLFTSRFISRRSTVQDKLRGALNYQYSTWSNLFQEALDINVLARMDDSVPVLPLAFRGDNALRSFHNDILDINRSEISEALQYYQEIGSKKYESPIANQRLFDNSLMSAYGRALEGVQRFGLRFGRFATLSWSDRVMLMDSTARDLGENTYKEIANEVARDLAKADGYAETYLPASISGYTEANKEFAAYKAAYKSIQERVMNSSYVSGVSATVISEVDGKTEFTFGDTFDVVVNTISNRGMKPTEVVVDIATSGNAKSMGYPKTISLPGMTRIKVPQRFTRLGWISDITEPEQTITLSAVVDGKSYSASFRVTLEEALTKIVKNQQAGVSEWMMGRIVDMLRNEWNNANDTKNGRGYKKYKNNDANLILVRMAKFMSGLTSEEEKRKIRSAGQAIRNIYGSKGDNIGLVSSDWEGVQRQISAMALDGSVPKDSNNGGYNQNFN